MARLVIALAATAAAWAPKLRPAGLRALPKAKATNADWRSACDQGVVSFYDFGVRLGSAATTPVGPAAATELLDVVTGKKACEDIVALIEACEASYAPKSFDEKVILGNWWLKFQLDSKQGKRSQKLLAGLPADSNFIKDEKGRKVFRNVARLSKKRIAVVADVAYEVSEGIPNRLLSDICAASIQIQFGKRWGWRPLRIPLPLKGIGWLDVTYLDDKLRVTRGNRGGLFVHVRPEVLLPTTGAWPERAAWSGTPYLAQRKFN
jgi:hypothetical protein